MRVRRRVVASPMTALKINLLGGGEWAGNPPDEMIEVGGAEFSILDEGMTTGKPSVSLLGRFRYDGKDIGVVWQTSLALLATAVDAAIGTHGDPRKKFTPAEYRELLGSAELWVGELRRTVEALERGKNA